MNLRVLMLYYLEIDGIEPIDNNLQRSPVIERRVSSLDIVTGNSLSQTPSNFADRTQIYEAQIFDF